MRIQHRSLKRFQTSAFVLVAMLAMLGLGVGQAGAQGTITERDTTINALANAFSCTTDEAGVETCTELGLHVSPDKTGTTLIVCLAVTTTTGEESVFEEGCADVAATFSMDTEELSWAMLAPTAVDLYTNVCNEAKECDFVFSRTVTVSADWIATGELQRVKETLGSPHGPCTQTDKIDGLIRDTATTVTIDGVSTETTGQLQVLDSRSKFKTNCG